jgi:thiol-disulfide isomerase/thioredoxin
MLSFKGVGAAAAAIILSLAGLFGFMWVLGDPDVINNINGWVLLAGFVLLLVGALASAYIAGSRQSTDAPQSSGAKAVGRQIVQILLILAGILGLVIVVGVVTHAQDISYRRPDFSLPDLDGRNRSIAEWDGNPLIINFWATWCIPCKREIPLFNQLQTEHAPQGLQILGIAVDTPENVREFIATTVMDYPTLVEEQKSQEVASAFRDDFLLLPFTVFLDHAGRVFWMQVEEISRAEVDAILARIWQVRSGELSYEQAQEQLVEELKRLLEEAAAVP